MTTVQFAVAANGDDVYVRGTNTFYPPTTITADPADPPDRSYFYVERGKFGADYFVDVAALRFETSSLPENATITQAVLRFRVTARVNADGRSITADWYSSANWPIGTGTYTATAGTDAHAGTSISSLTAGADNDLVLLNPAANINLSGYTGLRLHISGGIPTGDNSVAIVAFENTTFVEPRLIVTYTVPTILAEVFTWLDPDSNQTPLSGNDNINVLMGARGMGMMPRGFIADEVPEQAGARLRTVKTFPREVDLPLLIADATSLALQTRLEALNLAMDPGRGDGRLRKTGLDGSSRDLVCRYSSGLQREDDWGHYGITWRKLMVTLLAHDPYWYGSNPITATYRVNDTPALFFPILPIRVIGSAIFSDATINNTGDVEAWPVWTIVGPGGSLVLQNLGTGARILSTTTLLAGESLVIDTRPGHKTVIRNDGTNAFATLDAASEFWPLARGSNSLRIQLDGGNDDTRIELSFQTRFLGA
jgi:hypothetical protein